MAQYVVLDGWLDDHGAGGQFSDGFIWVDVRSAVAPSGTITTALQGIGQALAGSVAHSDPGVITTALSGVAHAGALVVADVGSITTSLQGISQSIIGRAVRGPGLGRRSSWTS